ncbi:hemicentin-2 isoform X3 [Leptopilina heterotoma]|uniref:hemicentin-2 isoform X3 n=1 Tax=Leptopilina heterotoma TaxID=63436 RepID=UPI001CA8E3EF|nr:hemicentin-2 isoform X3 [Leptopilina heterotoma]XP_043468187.1 hemicentin-2 isoform X3 [Leptopilina heterotoma]XP_043468188.1 hemicentin-2 isoform X3 [Leptopilina heterotoma]XP_043468189.1 hemicentin-2 isoform X3 [Leptopilina heterotoma]
MRVELSERFIICDGGLNYGLRQRAGSTEAPRGGTVNEAGLFALRGKQDGSRRNRRTTTSTTTSSTSTTLTSFSDDVAQPAALLAPNEESWTTNSPTTSDILYLALATSSKSPIELVVKPHSKVILPCELEGNYSKLVQPGARSYRIEPATWLHDDNPVDMITIDTRTEMSGTGHRYIGDSSTAALHIDNVRLEDDGIWSCSLKDGQGTLLTGRPVKLVVLEAPRGTYLLIDGRRLDPGNQFVPVKEGSELTLECAVDGGNPPPILAWGMTLSQATLDGPEQPPDNLTILPNTSGRHSGAHLKVLRGHHNATIICVARHVTLPTPLNASILLDVQYTPSFAITRLPGFGVPIVERMSVSLKCEVDSNPASAPIWQRDNGPPPVEQSDDGWLNFTKISRNETGWYKCYTRHMLGIFTSIGYFLNVRYNPEIDTETKLVNGEATGSRKMEVQIGGAVTLECDGGCWGHGPDMDPVGGPGPLSLNRVVYQDAGEYKCVAPDPKLQNTWRAQLPYQIKVTGRPIIHPLSQNLMAYEGESLDVIVEFCAEPSYTKVLWMSEKYVYIPGSETRDGVHALTIEDGGTEACYRTILRFESIQRSHAGEWLLLVRSPEGIADASVLLNVTRASGYSHAHIRSPSLTILLLCMILGFLSSPIKIQRMKNYI